MTFVSVKPGGWAVNEKLTSAQMNALDGDHVKSLDKTGDVLTGSALIRFTASTVLRFEDTANLVMQDTPILMTGNDGIINLSSNAQLQIESDASALFDGPVTVNDALTITGTTDISGPTTISGSVIFPATASLNFIALSTIVFGGSSVSANASAHTYLSGSTLTHNSSSQDTYLSGSTLTFNSGAITNIQNKPIFGNGISANGGDFDFNGPANVNFYGPTTIKGANRLKLDARAVPRVQPYVCTFDPAKWGKVLDGQHLLWTLTTGADRLEGMLHLPHGSSLAAVSVAFRAPNGHGSFPATMPMARVLRVPWTSGHPGDVDLLGQYQLNAATDFASNIALYNNSNNLINVTGLSEIVDNTAYHYYVSITPETGLNAVAGWAVVGWKATYSVSEYDDGR